VCALLFFLRCSKEAKKSLFKGKKCEEGERERLLEKPKKSAFLKLSLGKNKKKRE
jgi:hypothetical protein